MFQPTTEYIESLAIDDIAGQGIWRATAYYTERAMCYRPSVRPWVIRMSVRPSITRVDQSKVKLGLFNFHHTVDPSL